MWTAAILAGGQARRLGGTDKSGLLVGPRSILERQLAVLRDLTSHILVIGRGDEAAGDPAVRVVPDRVRGTGALGGIYTALVAAPTEQVLVLACDMPFLTAPFLSLIVSRGGADPEADVIVPRDAVGRHPICASYRRRVAPALKARIDAGALRVLDALDALRVREIEGDELAGYNSDGRLLFNVNTPDDYARAQQS